MATSEEQDWKRARGPFAAVFTAPALWLLAFFVVPLAIVWAYSFGETTTPTTIEISGTFRHYVRAFDPVYLEIFLKSAWMAALTTALCLVVGFPVALAITFAPERAKAWLLLLIMLPFWTNLLIRTYALMAVLRREGYVNAGIGRIAEALGWQFDPLPLLHNNFAVVLGLVYVNLPFLVLPLYAALDRLDRSLLEASLDLGAGHLRTIREIVVPLAMPGILSGLLITFIPALGSYLTPDLLGGPDSQMIANVIERQFKRANDWPFGAALSFILMYLTFILIAGQTVLAGRRRRREP
ncbi:MULTISPECIES: ABC transporter permease [Sphingomonadales]|uniref:ABC transporter permease n=2 Tax=Edaphosphingomonas TaxID=3423724 RepID=A0A2T4I8S8_9SPHN|nr:MULTISPECIES: ABC transporter permease [Sphingomonas]AGH49787.1 binding-protein-dependent transport system inner membrane protein [Sphingomonas sp. MM-1]MDX3885785.1 ABC transporter permease [Sphingomonas sp.]OHT18102.1 Spermidine/putrescine transport system permease protein PotB [Sphingomonas haloaromaticamans]PTD28137.1 ABC transporter permease [Sphingomonas fennica]